MYTSQANKQVTLSALRAASQAKHLARQVSDESDDSASSVHVETFIPFKAPPSAPVMKDIQVRLSALPGFTLSTPLLRESLRADQLPIGGSKAAVVLNPMSTHMVGGYDGLHMAIVKEFALTSASAPARSLAAAIIARANETYAGNGSVVGLIARMKSQLPSGPPAHPTPDDELFEAVRASLPVMLGGALTDDHNIENIDAPFNDTAHPGAPWFVGGVTVADHVESILLSAQALFLTVAEEGPTAYLKKRTGPSAKPAERAAHLVMLCPKHDIYDREDYAKKVRPFFVFPAAERMVAGAILHQMKPYFHHFLSDHASEHPTINAVGFSWTDGGARKFVEWMRAETDEPFTPASWGDDQVWRMNVGGVRIVMAPDVSGMDMKVRRRDKRIYAVWLIQCFVPFKIQYSDVFGVGAFAPGKQLYDYLLSEGATLSMGWFQNIMYYYLRLERHEVLTYKQLIYSKSEGLSSGVTGTTFVDMVGSGVLNAKVKEIPLPETLEGLGAWSREAVRVAAEWGYPLKLESMTAHVMVEGTEYLQHYDGTKEDLPPHVAFGLTFLGMRIENFVISKEHTKSGQAHDVLVPVMDPVKAGTHMVYHQPEHNSSPEMRNAMGMASLVGLAVMNFTGPIYDIIVTTFNRRVSGQSREVTEVTPEQIEGFEGIPPEMYWQGQIPTREELASLFATQEVKDDISVNLTVRKAASAVAEHVKEEEEEEEDLPVVRRARVADQSEDRDTPSVAEEDDDFPKGAGKPLPPPPQLYPSASSVPPPPSRPVKPPIKRASDVVKAMSTAKRDFMGEMSSSGTSSANPAMEAAAPAPVSAKKGVEVPPNYRRRLLRQMEYSARARRLYLEGINAFRKTLVGKTGKEKRGLPNPSRYPTDDDIIEKEIEETDTDYQRHMEQLEEAMQRFEREYESEQAAREAAKLRGEEEPIENDDEEDSEEDVYYDPTMPANRQAAAWFLGD